MPALPGALAVMLLCMAPSHAAEYGLVDHCEPLSALSDFEVWRRADDIIVAHLSDDAEYDEEKWYEAEFQIEDVLLGDLEKGAKVDIFAHLVGGVSKERLEAVFRRADLHDSPEFLPLRLTRFPNYGFASPAPGADECYPVPTVIRKVSYVIVRTGRKILSIEPVFEPSDYWLRFLKSLKKMHYWERLGGRAGAQPEDDSSSAVH